MVRGCWALEANLNSHHKQEHDHEGSSDGINGQVVFAEEDNVLVLTRGQVALKSDIVEFCSKGPL